jgi:hypothetical protein
MKEIYDNKQPKIEFCDLKQVYVRVNEEEIQVEEYDNMGDEQEEPTLVTKYQYDVVLTKVKYQNEQNVLDKMKELKEDEINEYDKSSNINSFTYHGVDMWLDKATRNGLIMRLNAEKAVGKAETTLWFDMMNFTLSIDDALQLLTLLEVYASACYDNTARHIAAVKALNDVEDVFNYDYTVGYPQKIVIEDILAK